MDALKLLGSLLGNNATSSGLGGQVLGQVLGGLMGGGAQRGGTGGGGLTDLLGGLMGGRTQASTAPSGGGLTDLLGSLMGGRTQASTAPSGGGLTDLLGSLMGGGAQAGAPGAGSGAGMLGSLVMAGLQMLSQRGGPSGQPTGTGLAQMLAPGQEAPAADVAQAHQQALAFVKAMINAAKADGQIDAEEQQKIVSKLGDVGSEEMRFIQQELTKPLNFDFFADITQDMAPQVYAVSLMAISLDTEAESSYMQQLAQGLGLAPQSVNSIHAQLGVAPLYA